MKINVEAIFFELKELRGEQDIKEQKRVYDNNIWRELKKIAQELKDYENFSKREKAEHKIIDGICNIALCSLKCWEGEIIKEINLLADEEFDKLRSEMAFCDLDFETKDFEKVLNTVCYQFEFLNFNWSRELKQVLEVCAYLCNFYQYDFRLAMLAKIKELRTGKLANYERIIEEE